MMKSTLFAILFFLTGFGVPATSYSQTEPSTNEYEIFSSDITVLKENVRLGCPEQLEDLSSDMTAIDPAASPDGLWIGDKATQDKADYLGLIAEIGDPNSTNTDEQYLSDSAEIIGHCSEQKLILVTALYGNIPQDVLAAMSNIEYTPGASFDGFEIGDVRKTSRRESAEGWIFLHGQTIGSADSFADYRGDDFVELFEIARQWEPNSGQENWENGDAIKVPDHRGDLELNDSVIPETDSAITNASNIVFNQEIKYAKKVTHELVYDPQPGASELTAQLSCLAIKQTKPEYASGVYWLDADGAGSGAAFKAYCDMESEGGGWTMVVAQYEEDRVKYWDEGIQEDYDPSLATVRGFAFV